jgi:hypothetical protein
MHLVLRYVYLLYLAGILVIASFYGFITPHSEHSLIPQVITNPWIGDPTCDHFIVQVTYYYLFKIDIYYKLRQNHFSFPQISVRLN